MSVLKSLEDFASKISEQLFIKSIRRGLMYIIPLVLIGSIVLVICNIPINGFQEFMVINFGEEWKTPFLYIYRGTFEIISIAALISISYSILSEDKSLEMDIISPIIPLVSVLGCYFTVIFSRDYIIEARLSMATGLFSAIIISVSASLVFLWFYRHRLFKITLFMDDADLVLSQTLKCLEPAFFTFVLFAFIKFCANIITTSVGMNFILDAITDYFIKTNRIGLAGFVFNGLTNVLWFFGLHGANILEPFNAALFANGAIENADMLAQGLKPTNIFTKEFFDFFVFMGGSGSSFCLILALLIRGKNSNTSRLAKFSIIPGIFNINEMIIYGLPVVLNPFIFVPFIITPLVLSFTSYLAMAIGLVPYTIAKVQWTAPVLLSGYVTTNSINGALLQLVNIGIGTAIYLPFVGLNENHKVERNKNMLKTLMNMINYVKEEKSATILNRPDEIGYFAKTLARDIYIAITSDENPMYLEYQPQTDYNGNIVGAEALLRWHHKKYGRIIPPLIVNIADEAGYTNLLGEWVIKTAIAELAKWNAMGIEDIVMSINITAEQLKSDNLVKYIAQTIKKQGVDPSFVEFELTENMALDQSIKTKERLQDIKKIGSKIALDDFGMGHGSLLYIRDFFVDTVKLDGTLVKDITSDLNSQEIVTSITNLCASLNLNIIAEVVETDEQKEKLQTLGCNVYQGYLYSPSLSSSAFVEYVKSKK